MRKVVITAALALLVLVVLAATGQKKESMINTSSPEKAENQKELNESTSIDSFEVLAGLQITKDR
jgi:maltose-binding protein MalE